MRRGKGLQTDVTRNLENGQNGHSTVYHVNSTMVIGVKLAYYEFSKVMQ